jgi:ABC-type lipoprotein export system ATPase subunit
MQVIGAGLSHQFPGRQPLFHDLDFVLEPSHVYALTGPSGSGKSTLLSMLAGWLEPTVGRIVRHGVDTVAWVFQNPHGVPGRSVEDHVALPLLAKGMTHSTARIEARERLARVGLDTVARAPFRELSGGEAQRLMLARGMAVSPSLLLVDEPTAQLDTITAGTVNRAIAAIADKGTIVVVATHDPRTRDACTDVIDLVAAA